MTAPITILAALGISALFLGIVGHAAHLLDVVLRRRAALRRLGQLCGFSTPVARRGTRPIDAIAVVLLGAWLGFAASAHADCGEERAAIKLGTDAVARRIALQPVPATIAELVLRPTPGRAGARDRVA